MNIRKYLFVAVLFFTTTIFAATTPVSYDVGISISHQPKVDAKNSVLSADTNMNVPFGNTNMNVGLEANYLWLSPDKNIINSKKISDYQETRFNFAVDHQITPSVNIFAFTNNPIHYNEKRFGKKQKSISFGGSINLNNQDKIDITLSLTKTNYQEAFSGVSYGNSLSSNVSVGYAISQKTRFSTGISYNQQNAPTVRIGSKKVELDKKTSGWGANLDLRHALDEAQKHNIHLGFQSSIGDTDMGFSAGYRYRF